MTRGKKTLEQIYNQSGTPLYRTVLGPKKPSGLEGIRFTEVRKWGKISFLDQKLCPVYREFQYTEGPV